ncbi:MAG: FeoC-like transcriptional regulator [Chloroflexota bacterium]
MLQQILQAFDQHLTLNTFQLARQLETSPELIEAMLDHLQRIGAIQAVEAGGEGCSACPMLGACSGCHRSLKMWRSSPKI